MSKRDLREARVDDAGEPVFGDGQACFALERAALSANNVTYAHLGDTMGYWRFFPAPEGWGALPVWGFGRCVASKSDGVKVGQRVYGYWPLAERLVVGVEPTEGGFVDPSPHRQGLADLYNRYEHRGDAEAGADGVEAAFKPLFMTGWLLDRWLALDQDAGAKQIVLTSASSKTSMGMAWTHRRREEGPPLIGLTSTRHLDFVKGLELYDEVLAYEDWASLDAEAPSVLVDVAGNRDLRAKLHGHFGDALRRSTAVGMTHGAPDATVVVPGTEASFFFAPQAIAQLTEAMGPPALMKAIGSAWAGFAEQAPSLVSIEVKKGIDAACEAFRALATGEVGGAQTIVIEP